MTTAKGPTQTEIDLESLSRLSSKPSPHLRLSSWYLRPLAYICPNPDYMLTSLLPSQSPPTNQPLLTTTTEPLDATLLDDPSLQRMLSRHPTLVPPRRTGNDLEEGPVVPRTGGPGLRTSSSQPFSSTLISSLTHSIVSRPSACPPSLVQSTKPRAYRQGSHCSCCE